jgi:adenylosuccinate synthase
LKISWKKDIAGIKKYSELPKEAQAYLKKIEELLGVPISWTGTGAERESIILH